MDNGVNERSLEELFLEKTVNFEGVLVQKTKAYSNLLTCMELAQELEKISLKREKSKNAWLEILTGEPQKETERQNGQDKSELGGDES